MILKKIRYKNIFSVGNVFIEIDLDKNDKTLIIGTNGVGKSTFISAICFGLYGKPFKEVNKPTIVNSINKKNLLVEIELENFGRQLTVRRGMKPDVFEIIENGKVWEQDGKSAEYQDRLEKEILAMNFVTFKQKVVVGSGGYTPFMKLKADKRRSIVEDMLDLTVFSRMNALLKSHVDENKKKAEENEREKYKNTIDIQSSIEKIKFLKKQRDKSRNDDAQERLKLEASIADLDKQIAQLDETLKGFEATDRLYDEVEDMLNKVRRADLKATSEVENLTDTIRNIEETDYCPTCSQHIDDAIKHQKTHELKDRKKGHNEKLPLISKKIKQLEKKLETLSVEVSKKNDILSDKRNLIMNKQSIVNTLADLETTTYDDKELVDEVKNYNVLTEKKNKVVEERESIVNEKEILSTTATLLKDNGVKASIITKYIPLINKTINEYLDIMNFYVNFEIDENFNEVIRSRHRDIFTYDNFSEGEKARIDLALLFAWRQVTKAKNNMECNLLVLDEVFDGSLDFNGTEDLLNILSTLEGSNVFVISHKTDVMLEKFEHVIKFDKVKNFTEIKELNENEID